MIATIKPKSCLDIMLKGSKLLKDWPKQELFVINITCFPIEHLIGR